MAAKPQTKKAEEFRELWYDFRLEEEGGASLAHNQINRNLLGILWSQLKDSCCEPFASDMPVYSAVKKGIYLPDVVVACGPTVDDCEVVIVDNQTKEEKRIIRKALHNPVLIAEVWSDSNKDPEKCTKLEHYRHIVSLHHYLTIEQHTREFLYYQKGENGEWLEKVSFNIANPRIEMDLGPTVSIALDELYYKVPV
jgi:Uma2 family endonuclease